ncbi:12579_t:CDS:2 [Funneliformis mosseae]|uniref:12579_t:CDS:1 n=1 Tax=Funneliformis mosseae TaxID=27381 RepID=A0A9N8WHF5_FUNMO|nr:12579_t:CDS:2 [Funneliformis mosseae]
MKDETKEDSIGESVCLKPKKYSVLLAGHDSKTPETDADFKKELEEEEFRKSQGVKYWEKKYGIQKAKGVKKCVIKKELQHDKFLEYLKNKKLTQYDMYSLCSYDHQIYLERKQYKKWLIKDIKLVQIKVIKTALRKGKKYDNLAKNYEDYLKKLQAEKKLNDYIKTNAVKIFSNEEAYTLRLENYRKRYIDNNLCASLKELYELYYDIVKGETRKRSDDKIEQMLKTISI